VRRDAAPRRRARNSAPACEISASTSGSHRYAPECGAALHNAFTDTRAHLLLRCPRAFIRVSTMTMTTIPLDDWQPFLARFSRTHRAWLTTVERLCAGQPSDVEGPSRPLDRVTPIGAPGGHFAIEVRFQDATEPVTVLVRRPTVLRLQDTADGAEQGLDIEDAEGACTRVRFRASALPEVLDGMAPGENW